MKRLQNRIAENGLVLPVMSAYGIAIWLAAGLVNYALWPQLVCFVLSVYMIAEMNNAYSLLRVRSRMVSGVFIALTCTMSFMFSGLPGALTQLFAIVSLLLLLSTYQDKKSLGRIFYAFLLFGLCSILCVDILLFVPLLWLLMLTQLQSLSWRGFFASLIGLATPYWFFSLWFVWQRDFTPLADHFRSLATFMPLSEAYATVTICELLTFVLTAALTLTGIVHFWNHSIDEKIRTRLFYGLFTWMSAMSLLLTALQPQLFDPMMRIAVVCASPLVAHFLTLTSTRITNIAFFAIVAVTVAVTIATLILNPITLPFSLLTPIS